jgi:hypothetical protein
MGRRLAVRRVVALAGKLELYLGPGEEEEVDEPGLARLVRGATDVPAGPPNPRGDRRELLLREEDVEDERLAPVPADPETETLHFAPAISAVTVAV